MPVYKGLENFKLLDKMGEYVICFDIVAIIGAKIGTTLSGAFSNVYKAVDLRTGQKVAGMTITW
jgi:hypothetical protein